MAEPIKVPLGGRFIWVQATMY